MTYYIIAQFTFGFIACSYHNNADFVSEFIALFIETKLSTTSHNRRLRLSLLLNSFFLFNYPEKGVYRGYFHYSFLILNQNNIFLRGKLLYTVRTVQ